MAEETAAQFAAPVHQCKDCKYFRLDVTDTRQGACLRFPPQWMLMPTPNGLQPASAIPTTRVDNYCGEFAGKLLQ